MELIQVLWVDDEITRLQPHIHFLEEKGYTVHPCTNGPDTSEAHIYDRHIEGLGEPIGHGNRT